MIEDKELDEIDEKRELIKKENAVKETTFSERMNEVKVAVLEDSAVQDKTFIKTVQDNLKDAAVKSTENEKKRQEFEGQQVDYESEKLGTKQQENRHEAAEKLWSNRQKRREYHYSGVKPIMQFVGINEPMNLLILYFLTVLILPFFLLSKFLKGTIGVLISGASNDDRPKAVKGFLWTISGLFILFVMFAVVYLFLKWQGIDILHK